METPLVPGGFKGRMIEENDATPSDFRHIAPKYRNTNVAMIASSMTKNEIESKASEKGE